MHIRPYRPQDSLALATIKAYCDLSDPLALYCRRVSPGRQVEQQQQQTEEEHDKQWKTHVKSLRRSLELELLFAGIICWVVVSDDDDRNENHSNNNNNNNAESSENRGKEKIVGFAIWSRHGSSSEARKWKAEGRRLSRRMIFPFFSPPCQQKK
jgi:hypothetical protein